MNAAVRWGLSLLLLAFVGWQLVRGGQDLAAHPPTLAPWPFAGACLGIALYLAFACEGWRCEF